MPSTQGVLFTVLALLLYPLATVLYNIFLHPLRKFPGPRLWATCRIPFICRTLRGDSIHRISSMHEKYGDIVRVAPDEISVADSRGWDDIFAHRPGHAEFPRNPVWWNKAPGQPHSIITVGQAHHARMRRVLSHAFSSKALREQEFRFQRNVDRLVSSLKQAATSKGGSVELDIVKWYNFCTFDIIGDVAVDESFDCLTTSSYHWWVATIFNHFKASHYLACIRFYPLLESLLLKFIPGSVMEMQRKHYEEGASKLRRRLEKGGEGNDMLSIVMRNNQNNAMTMDEIEATFNLIFFAGSETTGTTLTGITNHLARRSDIRMELNRELQSAFKREEEMTFSSLTSLPYLNAVIEEGLRMCPSLPGGLPRIVPAGGDTVLGHWLPEGTHVQVHTWALNRSQRAFNCPHVFAPERWLARTKDSPFAKDDKSALQPFSVGPRMCIGKNFAYAELRLVLARMVWNFDLTAGHERMLDWDGLHSWGAVEKRPMNVKVSLYK